MAQQKKVQIKGLIRFSYLSDGGYALSEQGSEVVRATLYDPDRLVRRFALFERLALHSIKLQKNQDFRLGLLIGETMPEGAVDRLKALIADVPQIQLIRLPQLPLFNAIRRAFDQIKDDPDATHTATFRLDDDDAMHKLTTDRIAKLSSSLLKMRNAKTPFAIAFNRGFYLDTTGDPELLSEWYERTPLGVGLTLVAPKEEVVNVYRRNHRKLGEFYDCHTEIGRPMYIRSVHQDNDSWAKPTGRPGDLTPDEIERVLWRGFKMTLKELRMLNAA